MPSPDVVSALLETSFDPAALIADDRVLAVSADFASLLGVDEPETLRGAVLAELFADPAAIGELLSGAPSPRSATARSAGGTSLALKASPLAYDGIHCVLVSARAGREVEGEALYRAVFEVNTAVKLLIEPSGGRIVDANGAAVAFYGWPLEELRQMRIGDINTLSEEEVVSEMENARSRRRSYFRFRHRTASGAERHVEVHSGPISLAGRELLLSIVHDVTDRDAFEKQLRRAQRLETVGRMAGGVAHDFNNLLTIMLGSCTLAARAVPDGSGARVHLADIDHAIMRASELTRQLLAISSRQIMRKRAIDLRALLDPMRGLLRRTLSSEIELAIDLGEVPPVLADPGQLEQVVLNLVLNARDAMPAGGRLTVSTRTLDIADPSPRAGLPPGRYAVLTVTDTGEGIDEAIRSQIFDPFFTTRVEASGTGLGLSTVYGIVAQCDGRIEVESALGEGTTFEIFMPATEEAVAGEDVEGSGPVSAQTSLSILLVEDLDPVRRTIERLLEAAGCSVASYGSVDEALEATAGKLETFDACVSDVVMPGGSGVDLARALRERRPELPIVLVSGDLRDHVRASVPIDVVFLQKPFSADALLRAIDQARA